MENNAYNSNISIHAEFNTILRHAEVILEEYLVLYAYIILNDC